MINARVKIKKRISVMKHFVLILTLLALGNSAEAQEVITIIEGKQININDKSETRTDLETFISPYRDRINKDLDQPLAVCPVPLEKSKGQWQTNIGDLLADIVMEKSNFVFKKRENKDIDLCILNHGGIRAAMPAGNVSARNAFEVFPFENSAVVIALKGEQVMEFVNYFITEKKPHPIAGITFTITADKKAKDVKIKNAPIVLDKIYYVVTNDYLAGGGDRMDFFKKGTQTYVLDYKLRNMLIDYMKEVDTLKINNEIKVTQEK